MPVEIDSEARPGSTLSVSPNSINNNGSSAMIGGINMNAAVGGSPPPIRPTTTSRRGGRSRSPVSGVPRMSPTNPIGVNDSNHNTGDNLSSAAAAAAAAAKIYSTSRRGPPWQQQHPSDIGSQQPHDEGPQNQHRNNMYGSSKTPPAISAYPPPSQHPHHHNHHPPPPDGWPTEENPIHRYRSRGPNGYHPSYDQHQHHRGPPPPSYHDDYDRRYHHHHQHREPPPSRYDDTRPHRHSGGTHHRGGMPSSSYPHPADYHRTSLPPPSHHHGSAHHTPSRGGPPQPQSVHQQQHRPLQTPPPEQRGSRISPYHHRPDQPPPPAGYKSRGGGSHEVATSSTSSIRPDYRSATTTTLVLGGTTPIHLPKSPLVSTTSTKQQSSSSTSSAGNSGGPSQPSLATSSGATPQHRGGSVGSVFRGRIVDSNNNSPISNPNDKDSPENILLSMRTPSTSFEEIKDNKATNKKHKSATLELGQYPPSSSSQQITTLFEQQRSSDDIRPNGSIDIAPSFPFLLNQSFDSFGDSFNVESTLQADSFGFGRIDSSGNDGVQQVLRKNSSGGGNFTSPFLAPSGSGGALTIGYSPVNSFGNLSAAQPRSKSNIMVLGGQDPRSASPTEALGMYRSYSGGTSNTRPLDDSHLRMSVGSFGGQSISAGYNRSSYGGDPTASPGSYYAGPIRSIESGLSRIPHFYVLLRKFRAAFRDCTFLLPGIKALSSSDRIDEESGDTKRDDQLSVYQTGSGVYGEPSPQDIAIAHRRVESSICAFGGTTSKGRSSVHIPDNREAIFRNKVDSKNHITATVTPTSTDVSGSTQSQRANIRSKYEEALPSRFYENENNSRLSWEFEERPPVETIPEDDTPAGDTDSGKASNKEKQDSLRDDKTSASDDDQYCRSVDETDEVSTSKDGSSPSKMRYRCKLCGQPKQNHTCPYQQALARSIGTMVYPAVNAFTADEPGIIAAPLSEMNNFVDIQKDGSEASPMRPSPDHLRSVSTIPMTPSAQVTPETLRTSARQSRSSSDRHGTRKRMYSQYKGGLADQGDLLFVEAMELKPEQFRIVSPSKSRKGTEGYVYPALPLPFAQRKRLSDNLFSLSNDVPKLTDECAQVLREAREKDQWDLAVAELMTQVIVIIHCNERDFRFEGLRQYLLTLGIAC